MTRHYAKSSPILALTFIQFIFKEELVGHFPAFASAFADVKMHMQMQM